MAKNNLAFIQDYCIKVGVVCNHQSQLKIDLDFLLVHLRLREVNIIIWVLVKCLVFKLFYTFTFKPKIFQL